MVERADELRQDIEYRRESIGQTVDQIENRVNPRRVAARGSYRLRRRLIDMKDRIMGNDNPDYPWQTGYGQHRSYGEERSMTERASELTSSASDALSKTADQVSNIPSVVRSRTQGNPLAAGLIALGSGLLVGSLLPSTRAERQVVERVEPALDQVRAEAKEAGQEMAAELKDSAREAVDQVKETAQESGERVRDEARESAETAGRAVRE